MSLPSPLSTARSSSRALIVEAEALVREQVRLGLAQAGYAVTEAADGGSGLDLGRSTRFDVIVLDVILPGIDGLTLCRAFRAGGPNVRSAILMLTAMDTESDKVLGLESGADDYVTKPFGMQELIARVRAVLRRHERAEPDDRPRKIERCGVTLDLDKRRAVVRGRSVRLTKQEFDFLHLLATRPGIVFSRAALLSTVWGGDTYVAGRTVDALVSRVRGKIEMDAQQPQFILTAWGVGYKFVDTE